MQSSIWQTVLRAGCRLPAQRHGLHACYGSRLASSKGISDAKLMDLSAPPPPPGLTPDQAAGRDLAKLAIMESLLRNTISEVASRGEFTPDLLVDLEDMADEAKGLITRALEGSGEPCTPEELVYRVSDDCVAIAPESLDYMQFLRMGDLRDLMETSLVHMDVLPPPEALLDGAGKAFCRLDRRELRRREFEKSVGSGVDEEGTLHLPGEHARESGRGPKSMIPFVSAAEIAKRKAALESSTKIEKVLEGFETALLEVSRVAKVTRGGTTLSLRALVVIGNRKGTAGYGEGKSDSPQHAIERACRDAKRNLLYIDRFDDRTLYHRAIGEYVQSRVSLWPAPSGSGISANNNFSAVLQLFGLRDVGAKLHGPRSLSNAVKALFNGLAKIRSAEEIASTRGLRLLSEKDFKFSSKAQVNQRAA